MNMRKQFGTVLTVIFTAALLSACASGPTIESDYDRSLDFSGYKTFGFFEPLSIESGSYSTLIGNQFRESIGRQMRAKGYVESDNADLTFNVSANFQEKTKVTQTQDPMMSGGYYGYRRGYYDPWGGYGYGTSTHVSQYTEGTVNVDMVDQRLKRMVWEGIAFGRLKEDRTNEERRLAIEEGVTLMFEGYPYTTSQ
jgi:hypothetical protein